MARHGRFTALVLAAAFAVPAYAAPSDETTVADLEGRIAILEARIRALEARLDGGPVEPPAAAAELDVLPDDQNRLVRAAFQRRLLERGGLLLPSGALDVDLSLRYLTTSSDRIVIDGFTILPVLVVGDIVSERVRHDFTELAATARLGLPWDMQGSLRVPAAYQQRRVVTAENDETTAYDFDLGDVELEVSRQLHKSRGVWPDLLASVRWKTDTGANPLNAATGDLTLGSGYDALGATLTAVSVSDPVVFFGGVSYTHNFATGTDLGHYEPGYGYGFDAGLALALNLGSSLSFSYDHRFTTAGALDGRTIPGSRSSAGVFTIGASLSATPARTLDFSVGIGLTEDAPDVIVTTSLPLRGR